MEAYPPPLPADPNVRPPVHPARGWLLVVLGLCLSAGMAYLANLIHGWILHNGEPGAQTHWKGSAEFTRTVYELFASVFACGLVAVAAGVYILRTRRISRVLAALMGLTALAIAYFGYVIMTTNVPR